MERLSLLEPRISVLEDDFDEDMLEAEAGNAAAAAVSFLFVVCKHSVSANDDAALCSGGRFCCLCAAEW